MKLSNAIAKNDLELKNCLEAQPIRPSRFTDIRVTDESFKLNTGRSNFVKGSPDKRVIVPRSYCQAMRIVVLNNKQDLDRAR